MDNIEEVNTKKALEARKRLDNNDEINWSEPHQLDS
jgi:hypothetical protein